jgi:DNA-binding response OmpR family regulator
MLTSCFLSHKLRTIAGSKGMGGMVNGGAAAEPAESATFGEDASQLAAAQARILVVEDDRDIANLVGRELRALGLTADVTGFAEEALLAARAVEYALMIVDLGLPDRDGLDLVREMRKRAIATPILMMTARSKVEDRVSGLASGADDYLVKPFAVPELRARVTALLRRPSPRKENRLAVGNIVVDRDSLEAVVDGASLPLTLKQFQLLELLARRKNHMTPKRMIEEALYSFNDEVSGNAIEAHVYKLRLALRAAGAEAEVETRRGIGYRLVECQRPNASDA